jgi:two-component system, cell cycle sensor histidine kinase and response regulator CckA
MSAAAEFRWAWQGPKTEPCFLFEYAPLGLAQCQRQGTIIALNPALEEMLGGRSQIAPSLCFSDLIHPHERVEVDRLFRELFERQRVSFQIDSQMIGGDRRPVRWTAWLVPGTNGNSDYALAQAEGHPHTHQHDHQPAQRLQQTEKLEALGRLAGGVAHDFNNLLTGILLYCDLLIAGPDRHRVRRYAEEIRNAGMQATGLVRQLLTLVRPTTFEPRLLSLNDVVESMRNLLVRLIGANIDLQFHLDPNLGLVSMDHAQSQQILLNLVLNARDAMPGGGRIAVETSNCNIQVLRSTDLGLNRPTLLPCALFVVADTGVGMDAATRAHLFDAFFTTKPGKGTGLGLATVYDIVTRNGGLLHVESEPARGARISVLLPLVPPALSKSQRSHSFPAEEKQEEKQKAAILKVEKKQS